MNLVGLPNEVLSHLILWLDVPDILNCRLVCKRLQSICDDNEIWFEKFKRFFPFYTVPENSLSSYNYRDLFRKVYLGLLSLSVQIINVVEGREMSAYNCIVKYDCVEDSYGYEMAIQRVFDVEIYLNDKVDIGKLRPIPPEVAELSQYEAFECPYMDEIKVGDEIEVQWRHDRNEPFGWWRGFVDEIREHGFIIHFPQYPRYSHWYSLFAPKDISSNLSATEDNIGLVGGIRKVTPKESSQWSNYFLPPPPPPLPLNTESNEEEIGVDSNNDNIISNDNLETNDNATNENTNAIPEPTTLLGNDGNGGNNNYNDENGTTNNTNNEDGGELT